MVDKHETIKTGMDIATGIVAISGWANLLDPIFTLVLTIGSIIWVALRIWDHRTVRKLTGRVE